MEYSLTPISLALGKAKAANNMEEIAVRLKFQTSLKFDKAIGAQH